MDWIFVISLCLLALNTCMACPASIETLIYVPSCPKTLEEWRLRAESKRCSHVMQNCTSQQNFVYHCVINNFANATMEVCAKEIHIIDNRCTEFNIKAEKIIESYTKRCQGYCPFKYNSTEAYKYQMCYPENYQKNPSGHPSNNTATCPPKNQEHMSADSNLDIIFGILFILSLILGFISLFIMLRYKRKIKKLKGKTGKRRPEEKPLIKYEDGRRKKDIMSMMSYNQCENKETDLFIIAIDIGEKYYGLAHTDLSNPQIIIPSHPMERIAVLIEKPNKIKMVGERATNEFIHMKSDELLNHIYVNEIQKDDLWKKVPETELEYIKLFTAATLGVIKRIEDEVCVKMGDLKDVRVVFSAGIHWEEPVKDLIDDFLETARASLKWEKGQEKVAFMQKVITVSQYIREAGAATHCLNFNIDNLKIIKKHYAVLNVGFGSCHLSFLHYRDKKQLDKHNVGGTIRRDWKKALPEDHVWTLCQEMIEREYINQQNKVRVINQYENLHERIRMCKNDETTFEFSFPSHIFKKNFEKIAKKRDIEIDENHNTIIIVLKWSLMKTFFKELKEAVKAVIDKSTDEFERLEIKCIFLIGGYSIMKMIQDAARYEWFKNITVVIPEDGGVSYAVGGATAGARGYIEFDATGYKEND